MTWYCTQYSLYSGGTIHAVNVERSTESSVWMGGRRRARTSEYEQYWETWQEAHAYLLRRVTNTVRVCRNELERAEQRMAQIKSMVAPTDSMG